MHIIQQVLSLRYSRSCRNIVFQCFVSFLSNSTILPFSLMLAGSLINMVCTNIDQTIFSRRHHHYVYRAFLGALDFCLAAGSHQQLAHHHPDSNIPGSKWSQAPVGELNIYVDDKLAYSSGGVASDITKPFNVHVDLTGALNIRIECARVVGIMV